MSREKTTSSPTLGRIYQHVARLTEGGGLLHQHAQHAALPDERTVAGARWRPEGRGGRRPARPLRRQGMEARDTQGREERLRQLFPMAQSVRPQRGRSERVPTHRQASRTASPAMPGRGHTHRTAQGHGQRTAHAASRRGMRFKALRDSEGAQPRRHARPRGLEPRRRRQGRQATHRAHRRRPRPADPLRPRLSVPRPVERPRRIILRRPTPERPLGPRMDGPQPAPQVRDHDLRRHTRPAARLQAPRPRLGRDHATVHRHARRPAARRRGRHPPRRLGGSRCSVSPT